MQSPSSGAGVGKIRTWLHEEAIKLREVRVTDEHLSTALKQVYS